MPTPSPDQPSFDDLGTALRAATFTVVDLETTGAGRDAEITEIGAVKVCGGTVVGEFQSLVRPDGAIPAMIQALTGITDAMVASAPTLRVVLPSFLDFAAGTVLVAHNAAFDIGFLRRGCEALGLTWRRPVVIDTVALARQVLLRDEVRNCKLGTLARHFGSATQPDHRALSDARATVDVLHGLLERVGNLGVDTVEDLRELMARVSPERRAKRVWAKSLPEAPGVYWFEHEGREFDGTARTEVLYVGKSRNLRRRVASYFSASEQRSRIHEMVEIATRVQTMRCTTDLEAEVRELRMIAGHRPRYNRRSRNQHRLVWLTLTTEAFPRLRTVRAVAPGDVVWGPFRNASAAQEVARCLQDAFGIRECTRVLSPRTPSTACALAELGRCSAPCELGESAEGYGDRVARLRAAWAGDMRDLLGHAAPRLEVLVAQERFEEAGEVTNRLQAAHVTSRRFHRVRALADCQELVAAAPEGGGWAIHVIRHGRLAAAGWARTAQVRDEASLLQQLAETVHEAPGGMPAGSFEEAERVATWLESPGVRLLDVRGDWAWPIHCAFDQDSVTELITTGVVGRSR
ncbi:MAG: DEDD exonuclease domain-containing protein [Arachnia propionica]|uniref:DEDD exonuclease domain-containing protein n=1 Tax=Arachnia propionica TaxID=1750 RepID=UPI00270DD70D|nr:DEDD exonuclease domain-containing protein [Arachnia propionica]